MKHVNSNQNFLKSATAEPIDVCIAVKSYSDIAQPYRSVQGYILKYFSHQYLLKN